MTTLSEQVIQYLEKQSEPQPANAISHKVKCSAVAINDVLDKLENLNIVVSALIDGRIRWGLVSKAPELPTPTKVALKLQSTKDSQSTGALALALLTEKKDISIQMGEIADAIGRGNKTVSVALHYLKKKGLVVNPAYGRWQLAPQIDTGVVIPEPVVTIKQAAIRVDKHDHGLSVVVAPPTAHDQSAPKFGYFSDGSFLIQFADQTMLLKPDQVGSLITFIKQTQPKHSKKEQKHHG